jgi:hypothetical protein
MSDWFVTDNATKVVYDPAVAPEGREYRNATYEEVVAARDAYSTLDPRMDAMTAAIPPTPALGALSVQENGTGKFLAGQTTLVITNAFVTADTTIIINLDALPVGSWSWESAAGSFTVTSTDTETLDVDFTWTAIKKGA